MTRTQVTDELLDAYAKQLIARLTVISDFVEKRQRELDDRPPDKADLIADRHLCRSFPNLDWVGHPGAREFRICNVCAMKESCSDLGEGQYGVWGGEMKRRLTFLK